MSLGSVLKLTNNSNPLMFQLLLWFPLYKKTKNIYGKRGSLEKSCFFYHRKKNLIRNPLFYFKFYYFSLPLSLSEPPRGFLDLEKKDYLWVYFPTYSWTPSFSYTYTYVTYLPQPQSILNSFHILYTYSRAEIYPHFLPRSRRDFRRRQSRMVKECVLVHVVVMPMRLLK